MTPHETFAREMAEILENARDWYASQDITTATIGAARAGLAERIAKRYAEIHDLGEDFLAACALA